MCVVGAVLHEIQIEFARLRLYIGVWASRRGTERVRESSETIVRGMVLYAVVPWKSVVPGKSVVL